MPKIHETSNNSSLVLPKFTEQEKHPAQRQRSPDKFCRTERRCRIHPARAIPEKYRNRPTPLRIAMRLVWEKAGEFRFTRADVAVLQAIIASGVSVETPSQPVFARKSTLAKLADVTLRTVFRSLKKLEECGFIIRQEQPRLEDGCLEISEIVLTEKLITLLNLKKDNNAQKFANKNSKEQINLFTADADKKSENSAKTSCVSRSVSHSLSHGAVYKELKKEQNPTVNNQSFTPIPVQSENNQDEFVRYQGRTVAKELFWLISKNRLTLSALFMLQKMAKNIGQKLSDFVRLRAERLMELHTSADCFRYLRSLILQGVDASHMCALKRRKTHHAHRTEQRKIAQNKRDDILAQFDGKSFQDPETGKIYKIHARTKMASVSIDGLQTICNIMVNTRVLNHIRQGKWRPWSYPKPDSSAQSLLASILKRGNVRKMLTAR